MMTPIESMIAEQKGVDPAFAALFGNIKKVGQHHILSARRHLFGASVSVDYDYCGSIAHALRARSERLESGRYKWSVIERKR